MLRLILPLLGIPLFLLPSSAQPVKPDRKAAIAGLRSKLQ